MIQDWSILVSLLSTETDDIVIDSSSQDCQSTHDTCFYHWNDHLFLDGFVEDLCLSFQLILGGGRLEVLRVRIPRQSLRVTDYNPYPDEIIGRRKSIYGRPEVMDNYKDTLQLQDNVEINYACHTYDRVYQLRIYMVSVRLESRHVEDLIHKRGHKIVCYAKLPDRDVYLGRPQAIETHQEDGSRSHRWVSPNPEDLTFESLSPRKNLQQQAEESKDHILLSTCQRNKTEAQISTRRIQHHRGVVWDNDAYRNLNIRLPLVVRDLDLYFYNFKFLPPKSVRVIIKWGQFVNSYLTNLNRIHKLAKRELCKHDLTHEEVESVSVNTVVTVNVIPGSLTMRLTFQINKERQKVSITTISLHAKDFENTLNQFSSLDNKS